MNSNPTKKQAWFGWCIYDWANSAFATVVLSAVLPVYFVTLVPDEGARISFFRLSRTLSAKVLRGYAVSCSMLIVAVTSPYLGSIADRLRAHRKFLFAYCLLGVLTTSLLFFATPGRYLYASLLFIIANIGFAGGNVFYNAFLPKLRANHELDRLSSRGFAYGYIGGGIALLIVFGLIQGSASLGFPDKGTDSRSFFSGLIPEGQHAKFFGFYAISAKFASVLGPFVFAFIVYITGSARLSILALTFFFVTVMLILSRVKEEKQPAAARPTRWLIFHEN